MDTTEKMAVAMTVERVLVGAAAIAVPGPLLTTFGAPAELNNPALRYTTRLFGIRNVALGLQVWGARNDPARLRELAGQNAAVELTDMVAGSAPRPHMGSILTACLVGSPSGSSPRPSAGRSTTSRRTST